MGLIGPIRFMGPIPGTAAASQVIIPAEKGPQKCPDM